MTTAANLPRISATVVLSKAGLQHIFDNLRARAFTLVGPTVRDGAVVLEPIEQITQLPLGYTVQQQPGFYRLVRTQATEYFGCAVGPWSWKYFLNPPRAELFRARRDGSTWVFEPVEDATPPYALIGVRACDLHAIAMQDHVFLNGSYRDPHYARRRSRIFVLAVNCTAAAANCFCTSMKTGPRASGGFDLALTELPDSFLLEVGSEAGSEVLEGVEWQPASAFDLGRSQQALQRVERQITRQFRTDDLPRLLYDNLEHPHWDDVAARCLSCGNCTMACPTCFCSTMEDSSDLAHQATARTRVWDSCFILDFSHVHGGNIRPTIRARYRQWLTHKLGSWVDQFGSSGCVGCGRCITWCPVGIDFTEELQALRTGMGVK